MTIPQKMPPYIYDSFTILLSSFAALFVLLMYIPCLYRTVYRIVSEKETRAKESMRMMGLHDLPYWASWLSYYSIVNFLISTISAAILSLGVMRNTAGLLIWLVLFAYGQSLFGLILITQSFFSKSR